jgi:class 3 adenylate cyclase/tetratricopeptide (TPR) repeat protein
VPICAGCGRESEGDFAFCPYCGAELTAASTMRAQRKTVTVLFCDVSGSTALGEATDPEAVRVLLARYFERMKGIVEAHGGTVEKFIGDAVMAVFGVPQVHEDDALRAVRAACEMRDALPGLGVQARIGLNTGEVVTGTEERLATGDAVNVAARLEQAAQAGEILIGEKTLALVRDAVESEAVEPLELKGKAEPVPAFRLVAVREAPEPQHETPFVGRVAELEALRQAWQRVCAERRCELVTVVGEAGVGKSRLTAEFLSSIEARSVDGRCLPYGEGITYWPAVEVIRQLDALPSDPAAADSLRSLLGESDEGTSAEEIAWAFRKLLEEQAQATPLVCVFDDIQWGEETFLDLVEHVALLSTGAQILVLCLARPELAERRREWPVTVPLEPLPEEDVHGLIPESLTGDLREKITRVSGGNPLFVTEMVAMAAESEDEVTVPPTLQALLAARLDQLEAPERSVLERGAVEGEIFHRGSVQALLPQQSRVTAHLVSLMHKGLIRPDRPQLPGDDAFRFRHLLIRDAAYNSLSKATRAGLHERFADWLERRGSELIELDEILGHHLEQAARYKQELGQPDLKLAGRAGGRLAAAGRRARWRTDMRAAATLLERALTLTRPIRLDVHLEVDLATAASFEDTEKAAAIADATAQRAREAGDRTGEALARVAAAEHRMQFAADPPIEELEALGRAAVPLLEQAEDHAGLVHCWLALGMVAGFRGRNEEAAEASVQALHHARLAGQRESSVFGLTTALVFGPLPADQALRALDAALPDAPAPGPLAYRACLVAMLGRFEEAWSIANEADKRLRELGGDPATETSLAVVATLAGDHWTAAKRLRRSCDLFEAHGERAHLSTFAPLLGRELCALGRYDEAERLAKVGRELGGTEDVATQIIWRQVQALVQASRGDHAAAEPLAREAVALAERTDSPNWQGDALCDLGEVLAAAGRVDEAATALEQALACYARKKNLAMVAQARPKLEELRKAAPA